MIVGLGKASELAEEVLPTESKRQLALRTKLLHIIQNGLSGVIVNGDLLHRVSGNLNISITGVDIAPLLNNLKKIAVTSKGYVNNDGLNHNSVIQAIDHGRCLPPAVLRISIGRYTTEHDIETTAEEIIKVVNELREENPKGGEARQQNSKH